MSVDREIRHSLEFAYAHLAGEPPDPGISRLTHFEVTNAGGAWVRETSRALDRLLPMMNELGDPGTVPLAALPSGRRGSAGRLASRFAARGWLIGEGAPGQEGWVTQRLWLCPDGTVVAGESAGKIEREIDRREFSAAQWPAVVSIPWNIGKILAENGLEWLPQAPEIGYGPKPRLDGLYVAHDDSGSSYLRFSSGGRVSRVASTQKPAEVAAWLGPEDADCFQGVYFAEDREVYFGVSSPQSLLIFHGWIAGATGALVLRSRIKTYGITVSNQGVETYAFVSVSLMLESSNRSVVRVGRRGRGHGLHGTSSMSSRSTCSATWTSACSPSTSATWTTWAGSSPW
jgi:hypothetical protein